MKLIRSKRFVANPHRHDLVANGTTKLLDREQEKASQALASGRRAYTRNQDHVVASILVEMTGENLRDARPLLK